MFMIESQFNHVENHDENFAQLWLISTIFIFHSPNKPTFHQNVRSRHFENFVFIRKEFFWKKLGSNSHENLPTIILIGDQV